MRSLRLEWSNYGANFPAGAKQLSNQRLTLRQRNSGKTGGGSVVFASLTRLPLILWRDGSTG
jgi:hypothetical protein